MSSTERSTATAHPLEPLTTKEIAETAGTLRRERGIGDGYTFVSVSLHEPPKDSMLNYQDGDEIQREAFVVLRGSTDGATYEAVVSISKGEVKSWERVSGVQSAITPDEVLECERIVAEHPEVREALEKRGITDLESVVADAWAPGHYADGPERRLLAPIFLVRMGSPEDNYYVHPVENLVVVYDVDAKEVVQIEDHGVVPVPKTSGNYTPAAVGELRDDLMPIEITQPEGTSFEVDGHEVRWQKWRFRVGFTPRDNTV